MTTLVITVVGDDRAGLVSALADVIAEHGASWGTSRLAELAGKFAGVVTVELPPDRVEDLVAALEPLAGVLETTVHEASGDSGGGGAETYRLELVGNDRPGIVREISSALAQHGVSIEALDTRTAPTPEGGGDLFEASASLRPTDGAQLESLRTALESLAQDLMVDITLQTEDEPA